MSGAFPSRRARPVKLIVQIPCLNEAATLPLVLADLPQSIPGVDVIEVLVIDDGSVDDTSRVAREHGVQHIVRFPRRKGLAKAFAAGLEASLAAGADVIVNTDADNQYCGADVARLVEPVLAGRAELVIGERPISEMRHFSLTKKVLQRIGSWVVRRASGADVPDAPSGFRAFSRTAAAQIYVLDGYTYTLESLIRAAHAGLTIESVPIRTNAPLRPSRLIRSSIEYVCRSAIVILRTAFSCRPLFFYATAGAVSALAGLAIVGWLFAANAGLVINAAARLGAQAILAGVLILLGVGLIALGLVADLVAANRKLLERIDSRLQRLEDREREAAEIETADVSDESTSETPAPVVPWRRRAG